jgi:hypothetical protein
MNIKTWKKIIAAILICVTFFSSQIDTYASQTEDVDNDVDIIEGKVLEMDEPSYTEDELRLMSAIIFCEAGAESYTGKVAVGIVVMNRVRSSEFPNTVSGVIYQKKQFTPARSGALAKALKTYDSGKFTAKNHLDSIKAAKKVLEGCTTVTLKGKEVNMKSYLFFSVYLRNRRLIIGNHMFR